MEDIKKTEKTKVEENEEKEDLRMQKKLKKLENRKPRIRVMLFTILICLIVGWSYVYIGSHKDGISWDEVYERYEEGVSSGDKVDHGKDAE